MIPNDGHPGDQNVCYVACHDLDSNRPIQLSDVAEVKRAEFRSANDFHLTEDFIGKSSKFPIYKGSTVGDTNIETPRQKLSQKDLDRRSNVARSKYSQSVPALQASEDIPKGGIACADNLKQVMVAYSEIPDEVITEELGWDSRPARAYLAKTKIPKKTIVTYNHVVDNSSESNMRHFVATRDLPRGTVLTPPDLVAIIDEEEMSQRIGAVLDGDRETEKRLHEGTFDFSSWFECRLERPLKKGEELTREALGPLMTKIAFAAHDLKPGVSLKESDVTMKFVEEAKVDPQKDVCFSENMVGEIPKKPIKSGTRINEDDLEPVEAEE